MDLYAKGSWLSSLGFGWTSGYSPTGAVPSLAYPGIDKGFVFNQVPDFSISLWLMKRYYFEVTYKGGFDKNTLLLGYRGRPGEILQWAKIGNAPITIPPRASTPVPEGRAGTPGFGISFASPFSVHDLLIRYEDTQSETKIFKGTSAVDETTIALDQWIHGRFFKLPASVATYPASGLTVLIQDNSGSFVLNSSTYPSLQGLFFRLASADEVYLDPQRGEFRLAQPSTKVLLVTWTSAPPTLTDPLSGMTFSCETGVSGQSGNWYVLYQPGAYSPFELKDKYPIKSYSTSTQIGLYNKGTNDLTSDAIYTYTAAVNQDWFTLGFKNQTQGYPPFWYKYPGIYYGGPAASPNQAGVPNLLKEEIRISSQTASQTNDLYLGTGILAGSVIVTRNGYLLPITSFDSQTGKIGLNVPIFDSDNITVTYQKEKDFQKPTDLAIFQGNQFILNDKQDIQTMETFRWNLAQGRYTDSDMQAPGKIEGAVEWNGREGPWNWKTGLRAGGVLSDSTGYRRVYGMSKNTVQVSLDSTSLRPASAPYTLKSWSSATSVTNLIPNKRGTTYFRNYWTNDSITGLPVLASATKPGVNREAYKDGGTMGPYLVLGDDVRPDRLVSLEPQLAAGEWSGFHVYFDKGQTYDLSTATKVILNIRLGSALPANTKIYFQAGYLGNNFDGTSSVSSKTTNTWPGMTLIDRRYGWSLTYPLPEDSSWTNDTDGSGVIKQTAASSLITRELTLAGDLTGGSSFSATSTAWQNLVLTLTDDEKNLLKNATGWRLIVVNTDPALGWSSPQTLLCSSAEFYGTSFSLNQVSSASSSVYVQEIPEVNAANAADKPLNYAFEETGRIFHSDGSVQKILEAVWNQSPWTISGRNNSLRYSAYRTLVVYYRVAQAASKPRITLNLTDSQGKGLYAQWDAPVTTGWQRMKIDIPHSRILSSETGFVLVDSSGQAWDRMTIKVDNASSGILYMAEIHCEDPLWEFTGTWSASGSWRQDNPMAYRDLTLVSGTVVSTQSDLSTTSTGKNSWLGQSRIQTNLGPSRWKGELSILSETDRQASHGAYSTVIPIGPVEFSDEFSDYGYRSDGVKISFPYLGNLINKAKVQGPPVNLNQYYNITWGDFIKPALPEGWTNQISHTLVMTWNEKIDLETFGSQWAHSWSWYTPREGIPQFVQMQQEGHWAIPPAPLGLDIGWEFQTSQTTGTPYLVTPSSSWTIGLPFKFDLKNGSWLVQQDFTRKLTLVDQLDNGFFVPDLPNSSANRLLSVPYGPFGLPFQEFFSAQNSLSGQPNTLSSGNLESRAVTTVKRPREFRWTDLVYPLQGDLTLDTQQIREDSSLLYLNTAQLRLSAQALNLYGRSGVHPTFPWYETDEWSWSINTGVTNGSQTENKKYTLGLSTLGKIFVTMGENFGLPIKFDGVWSYQSDYILQLGPTWELRLPANLPFEFPRWLSPKAFPRELIHSIGINMKWDWNYDTTVPIFQQLYTVYKCTLKISQGGELTFTGQWGNQWQKTVYLVGLEASLDLKLSF